MEDDSGRSVEIFFRTSSSLAFVRDARNSFAGEWAAMATANASPRLFGPTPVMTTALLQLKAISLCLVELLTILVANPI